MTNSTDESDQDHSPWLKQLFEVAATPSSFEASAALAERGGCVSQCTRCPDLVQSRTQTVYGRGSPTPRVLFLGEAPGATEDAKGKPFVGPAGQLLDKMIDAIALSLSDYYICNVIKCRPEQNRRPRPDEVHNCRRFLTEQIAITKPEVICCLGATAAHGLLGTTGPLGPLRQKTDLFFNHLPVICTWHPAYLLRRPEKKREAWEDLQKIMGYLSLEGKLSDLPAGDLA